MSTSYPRQGMSDQAEQINHGKSRVNLPQVPPSVGREMPLDDAPVVVYQMHGEPVQGLLHRFDHTTGKLTVLQRNGTDANIEFTNLRFLVFARPLLSPLAPEIPEEHKTADPATHSGKAFELLFKDGRKFHATAETVLIEPVGIHIFIDKSDGHIHRLFVPKCTVNKYNLDISISKGLVEHRTVGTETRETPLSVISNRSPGEAKNEKVSHHPPVPMPHRVALSPPAKSANEVIESLSRKSPLPTQHLGELLLAQNIITPDQLDQALSFQRQHPDNRVAEILVRQGAATPNDICATLAFKLGLPFVKLDFFDIDSSVLSYVPRDLAVRLHLIPLFMYQGGLVVAMSDPLNSDACKIVEFLTQQHIEAVVAVREDVDAAIDEHYRRLEDDEVIEQFKNIDTTDQEIEKNEIKEAERLGKEKTVVRLVKNMIIDAVDKKASDIHIRPDENEVSIIFRIDGTLIPIRSTNKQIHAAVVSRIKIIGNMDISERRVPQDGRASINLHGKRVDLRISIMPTINGESVVIRILDTLAGVLSIDKLGFASRDHRIFQDMIGRSSGILLVTGPTGSGKSTTLYAALQHILKQNVNIITAEDPVEYHISGIEQMQVNHKIDYSFARILRNILRHDPDVIMVGEIRDQETAKTAIESALTGHLVLSTLHTNSAAVTITRLLEMGIDPYLINDTLLGVLAQRLVRMNCPECLVEEDVAPPVYDALGLSHDEKFFHGRGCDNCHHTGYKGRLAVYELLQMNQPIRAHVLNAASSERIHDQAVSAGMIPLTANAISAARERKTSLAEVYRVRLE